MAAAMSFFHHLPLVTIFGLLGLLAPTNLVDPEVNDRVNSSVATLRNRTGPTFYRIYKKKSTEGYQSLPYVVALFSSMLWILYAMIAPNSTFLKTINSFGMFIETVYITIFLIYATKEAKMSTVKLIFLMNIAGLGAIAFVTFFIAKTTQVRIKILGWICLIFSLCVFIAPLGVMRTVIRTKSVKYMPFLLSFFLTISAVMWFFYGLLRKDIYVAVPNVLGFSFGIVQMVLYAMYRNSNKSIEDINEEIKIPTELATTNDHIIEVIELAPQGTLYRVEAPQMTVMAKDNHFKMNEEGFYSVEIRNVNQEMIEKIKKIEGIEGIAPPNLVTVAA